MKGFEIGVWYPNRGTSPTVLCYVAFLRSGLRVVASAQFCIDTGLIREEWLIPHPHAAQVAGRSAAAGLLHSLSTWLRRNCARFALLWSQSYQVL